MGLRHIEGIVDVGHPGSADCTIRIWECSKKRQLKVSNVVVVFFGKGNYLDVSGVGSQDQGSDRINGLVFSPTYKWGFRWGGITH